MTYEGTDYDLPCVFLPFAVEVRPHRLWGMTLRMVDTLVELLR